MKAWSNFLKDVLVHVPGCPEPVAEHALLRAAQEFFETTRVWKLWLPDIITAADTTEYPMFLESKSELVRLERATLNGRPIRTRTVDELPDDWQTYTSGIEDGVHTTDRKNLVLLPSQEADLVLKVEASMKPANDATGVEDHFFDLYVLQIAAGAVAGLKEHTGKTYSDADGALTWRMRFDEHMSVTDFQRFRGYSSARPRRQIRTF
jgi:hypothetical protein